MRRKEEAGARSPFDLAITEYLRAAKDAASNNPTSGSFLPVRSSDMQLRDQGRWHAEAVHAGLRLIAVAYVSGKPDKSVEHLFTELGKRTSITPDVLRPLGDALIYLEGARIAGAA